MLIYFIKFPTVPFRQQCDIHISFVTSRRQRQYTSPEKIKASPEKMTPALLTEPGQETVNDFPGLSDPLHCCLSLCQTASITQLAGHDTVTNICAEVCRATQTQSHTPLTVPTACLTSGCLFKR
ncbi:uncharacterized protein ACBT44_004732 [Syngnathus typhle]